MAKYEGKFYQSRHANTFYSANRIIDLVNDWITPDSIIDIGCGVGTWLKVFQEKGAKKIFGVEGKWVDESNLVIKKEEFTKADLEQPFDAESKFDLAISLEVEEHINEEFAEQFVKNLTSHAPVILFSAAIPLQGGKHHVNEQWPTYWKEIFEKEGYVVIDCVRPEVWDDEEVEMWYAQNTFIYVDKNKMDDYPKLKNKYIEEPAMLNAVLPRFYEFKLFRWPIMKAIRNKLKRTF